MISKRQFRQTLIVWQVFQSSFIPSSKESLQKRDEMRPICIYTTIYTIENLSFDTAQLSGDTRFEDLFRICLRQPSFRFYNFNSIDCESECFFSLLSVAIKSEWEKKDCLRAFLRVSFVTLILDSAHSARMCGFPMIKQNEFFNLKNRINVYNFSLFLLRFRASFSAQNVP